MYDANQEYDKPDLVVKKVKQTIKESANFNNSLYADERALSVAVSQVYKFVYDIHKGDVVIIPAENSNKICIGLFEEDFIADNKQTTEKFVYTRKVKWIKQLEKDISILSFTSCSPPIKQFAMLVTIKNT